MLAGKLPFEADSAVSVALMQLQKDPERLTAINPDIPLGLEQICFHAMQKNPQDRYQTATEMLLDLEEIIRNPKATFDYTYFVDQEPTRYVFKEDNLSINNPNEESLDENTEDNVADPKQKKKIITAVVIGVVLLIAAIVGVIVWMTQGVNTETRKLENFIGQSYDDLISSGSFDYEFIAEYEQSDDKPSGTILSQSPSAGEKVIKGAKVTLVVAKTVDDIPLPNCYDVEVERAKTILQKNNLTNIKIKEVSSENVEPGFVVYTDPKASSIVSANREIILYVSTGPSTTTIETLTVPDVTGLSQSDAKAFLKKAGFSNVTFETADSTVKKDIVISQSPSSGASVKANSPIKVTLSTGFTTTAAPDEYSVNIKVILPKCRVKNKGFATDDIVVTVNGSQYESRRVTLNGSNVDIAIPGEPGSKLSIKVQLRDLEDASQSFELNINENKNKTIDFSEYSDLD